ncbi:MAG: prepilin-type N-terminal cleavage/methylation domain-containing protein [Bdellovibrionales bacterium]|nr:prepilin-type N-terminal cleavage/methylation domain-containing protein [Bdellovibrionales bacterium]
MRNRLLAVMGERGFTLAEMVVTLGLSSLLFSAVMTMYSTVTSISFDHHIRIETFVQAQAIMQSIGGELRVLGNGVPFDQANFQIGEDTLSDPTVTEPIQLSSLSSTSITYRLNETGNVVLLTADFDPSSSLVMTVTDASGFAENDPIYISNSVVSGDDGLYGVVASVNAGANQVTLEAGYVASPDAVFEMGSTMEEVPFVTITTGADGITRDSGFGAVLLGENATISFDYLDANGASLVLPLETEDLINSLRSIRVTVTMSSKNNLKNGTPFTTTVTQAFGLRNLNYLY